MAELKRPSHLRVVGDEPPPRPRGRRPREAFTQEQWARLVTVLHRLHRLYGTWKRVAEAMDMTVGGLRSAIRGQGGSMRLAVRAAHAAGIPVETIAYGTMASVDRCAHCGQKLPEG